MDVSGSRSSVCGRSNGVCHGSGLGGVFFIYSVFNAVIFNITVANGSSVTCGNAEDGEHEQDFKDSELHNVAYEFLISLGIMIDQRVVCVKDKYVSQSQMIDVE
jgi:hypothetical protein